MTTLTELLGARLRKLGMHFEGEQLDRAEALVRSHTEHPHALDDVNLMTIAVEAYRETDKPMRDIV